MSVPALKIAGVEISLNEFPAQQGYKDIGGLSLWRMANGAALAQQHWRKLSVSISGNGWSPPALKGIDWSAPVVISCIAPRSVASATVNATLPAARRSDTAPYAMALVDGKLVTTAMSLAGDTATATTVSGASGYRFFYYPQISCYALNGVVEALDTAGAAFSWSIEAEEI